MPNSKQQGCVMKPKDRMLLVLWCKARSHIAGCGDHYRSGPQRKVRSPPCKGTHRINHDFPQLPIGGNILGRGLVPPNSGRASAVGRIEAGQKWTSRAGGALPWRLGYSVVAVRSMYSYTPSGVLRKRPLSFACGTMMARKCFNIAPSPSPLFLLQRDVRQGLDGQVESARKK